MTTSISESTRPILLALVATSSLSGCSHMIGYLEPGTTYGQIVVGKPRVSTRERLINDRLEEDAWLKSQLRETDNKTFGVQGKADLRSFAGIIGRVGVQADSRQARAYREQMDQRLEDLQRERELKSVDYQIALQKKQKELADAAANPSSASSSYYGKTTSGDSVGAPKPPSVTSDAAKSTQELANGIEALNRQLANLAGRAEDKKAEPTVASVAASPIEEFRDRLAYREEIRSEQIQNALDDAHDLDGNTLYRLSFDTTIVPDSDTSAWAVITVTVRNPSNVQLTPDQFARIVNQRVHSDALQTALAVEQECSKADSLASASSCLKGLRSDVLANLHRLVVASEQKTRISKQPQTESFPFHAFDRSIRDARQSSILPTETDRQKIARFLARNGGKGDWETASNGFTGELLGSGAGAARKAQIQRTLVGEEESDFSMKHRFIWPRDLPSKPALGFSSQIPSTSVPPKPEIRQTCQLNENKRLIGFTVTDGEITPSTVSGVAILAQITVLRELYGIRIPEQSLFDPEKSGYLFCNAEQLRSDFTPDILNVALPRISAYGATPKESVQRVSEVLSRREASEFAVALQTVTGAAGVDGLLNFVKANDALFHAIRRQPLVVGFAGNPHSTATSNQGPVSAGAATQPPDTSASFGWVIGPKFEIRAEALKQSAGFRHVPIQNSVAGVVSVPTIWNALELDIEKCWKAHDGRYVNCQKQRATVNLPADPMRAFEMQGDLIGRRIELNPLNPVRYSIRAGESASLVIRGENLWRNATVLLGGQEADRITVLPDMGGIVAHFRQVQPSGLRRSGAESVLDLSLSTSEGFIKVADVALQTTAVSKQVSWSLSGAARTVIPGQRIEIRTAEKLPQSFHDIALMISNIDKRVEPMSASTGVEYLESTNSVRFVLPATFTGWESGDRVVTTAVMRRHPGDANPESQRLGTSVYYASTADAQAKFKVTPRSKRTYDAEITFPLSFREAFPVLALSSKLLVVVTPTDSTGQLAKREVICEPKIINGEAKCSISISFDKDINSISLRIDAGPEHGFPDTRLSTN